jgi:hypothetical protein
MPFTELTICSGYFKLFLRGKVKDTVIGTNELSVSLAPEARTPLFKL